MDRAAFRYASCYCEENVWHLAADPRIPARERFAVFITNADRICPMWAQRASRGRGAPIVWDYHVVLLAEREAEPALIYDLDSRLAFPIALDDYLAGTFPFVAQLEPRLQPRFRVVRAEELLANFASDRSHMREGDDWRAPPPSWPAIATADATMNLDRFLDVDDPWIGERHDLDGLRARFRV